MSASDACGMIGLASTSITLAFSPGELSTFVWELYQRTSSQTFTSALDIADLPCGPWNGTDKFLPEPWSNYSSYQPLIVLPSKLINMVPAWKSCTADMFEGQDPPRALTPAAAMAPSPTDAETDTQNNAASPSPQMPSSPRETGAASSQPAEPISTPISRPKAGDHSSGASGDPDNPNVPSKPSDPSNEDPGDSSDDDSPDPTTEESGGSSNDSSHPNPNDPSDSQEPANEAASPATSPASNRTPTPAGSPPPYRPSNPSPAASKDTKNTPPAFPPAVALQGHTITQGPVPGTVGSTPVIFQSGTISAGGEMKAVPIGWGQSNGDLSPMTVGGLTFSAVPSVAKANGDPYSSNDRADNDAKIISPDPPTYITVGGQTIAVDADVISVAATTLKPGDRGVTINGTPISLGSSILVVGTRTEALSTPQATTPQPPYITVGSQTFSLDSSAIVIHGNTLNPADPGITVDGTYISLGSSILVIGSHTQSLDLPQPTPTLAPSYITIGGETIAVAGGSILVAGHTVKPGSPAVTADGTLISLGSSVLVVGTQTMRFTLPTADATASASDGIGAMVMKGLGGIGAGTVPAPTQTAGSSNGTGSGDVTVVFTGGGAGKDAFCVEGWVVGVLVMLFIL